MCIRYTVYNLTMFKILYMYILVLEYITDTQTCISNNTFM